MKPLSPDLISRRLGLVTLEPAGPVIAGSLGQWRLVYTVGSYGLDEGGTIKMAQRMMSDWETPQFDQPTASGYTTVTTTGPAKLRPYYHRKAYDRPWSTCLVIDVYDGSLAPGDTVTITLGDRSQGSPGMRAQTFQEKAHEFRLLVDPTNAAVVRPLPTSPKFPIIAGDPVELVCILPSQAVAGEPIQIFVKGQDYWNNPTPAPDQLSFAWEGAGRPTIEGNRLTLPTPGCGYLIVSTRDGAPTSDGAPSLVGALSCRSNPITVFEQPPKYKRYWGDLHAQTEATVGTGTEVEYFTFGRDVARLDFISHQGNDFQVTDEDWRRLNEATRFFHEDGRFVVFPGYEWSANTPAGGDRNVFYLEEGLPIFRSSHWQIPEVPEDEQTPAHPASVLFERIRQSVDPNKVLLGSHVGGRYADIRRYFDEELGPLVEVLSCWGVFEWLLWDAFEQGYIVGVMCNSDGHKGRPGAEGPGAGEFGIAGGLTCVLAESLSRSAIFAALKARRCYGVSGPRLDLDFTIDQQPMGSVIETRGQSQLQASVKGTAPLESLTLFRGKEAIKVVQPAAFSATTGSKRIRLSWQGSRIRGRGRRVTWDGLIRVSGVRLASATTVAFDAKTDGILHQTSHELRFKSCTTGDTDGIDLFLDQSEQGTIIFDSQVGRCEVNLGDLNPKRSFNFGGLGMQLCFERYPEQLTDYEASLSETISPPPGQTTPYFVKAIQSDGHMAWSSPIYVKRLPQPQTTASEAPAAAGRPA
jgi:hypothetical protein